MSLTDDIFLFVFVITSVSSLTHLWFYEINGQNLYLSDIIVYRECNSRSYQKLNCH